MAKRFAPFAIVVAANISLTLACGSSDGVPGMPSVPGGGAGSVAGANAGGQSNPGGGASGANTSGGSSGSSPGGAGATGAAGAGGQVAGGGSSGAAGNGGGSAGAAGSGTVGPMPHGKSAGCNKLPPATDTSADFKLHDVQIAGLDPAWLGPNGFMYVKNKDSGWGTYDYSHRPYSVRLPKNYDNTKAYPITMGGGGCGGSATGFASGPGGGYQVDNSQSTIQVGLSYLGGCFDDGGGQVKTPGKVGDPTPPGAGTFRTDTPEVPYVRAVIAAVAANYCVDLSEVSLSGTSSGGWESITVGCGAADVIRSIGVVSGGLRLHRPACTGPQASMFVEGKQDTTNPIGPQEPPNTDRDSPGSAPARDEILKRNGCVAPDFAFTYTDINGNAPHAAWDPMYPKCVTYTGCPKETPVVWCALDCGHQCDKEDPISYKDGFWKFFSSLPSRP